MDRRAQPSVEAAVKAAPFDYLRPDTVAEALSALAEHGTDARVIAGGQSLGAMLNMRIVTPKVLIDINRLSELSGIARDGRTLVTGAMLRQADALADELIQRNLPLLAQALPHVGHYQTRNRGTLGGSVAHADPSAEIPLSLATLDGEIELRSKRGRRRLKAREFFQSALVTARQPDELVTALHWPARQARQGQSFLELAVREGDYAIVAVACVLDIDADDSTRAIRLGFGGCGGAPQIVEIIEVADPHLDKTAVETVARDAAAQIECRSDVMASAGYRRQLATVLAGKAILAAGAEGRVHA
jgi:2-furoyl-CoA dehydrogenase FAD binding subunit